MKLTELARTFSPTVWLIGAGGAVLLLLTVWWIIIGGPAHDRKAAAEARAASTIAKGRADAAADAVSVVTGHTDQSAITEAVRRNNADAIDNAPGASAPVDPGLAATGRRGLCNYAAYHNRPECLQHTGPR